MVFDPVWASDGVLTIPSEADIRAGFECGRADPGLFNYLIQILQSAINDLDVNAPVPVNRRIDTTDGLNGGGDLSQDRLIRIDFSTLTAEASIANDDLVMIFDASANALRVMTRADFVAGLGGGGGGLTGGSNIGAGTGSVFSSLSGTTLQFRQIKQGTGLSVVTSGDDVVVSFADYPATLTVD